MAKLLFANKLPAETTGAEYMAGVLAISNAIAAGNRIHTTLTLPENNGIAQFYAEVPTIKVSIAPANDPNAGLPYFASGLLVIRPTIDNFAEATAPSPLVSGSVDTWGRYWYNGTPSSGYVISWWAS
jgi:hypothetical protein